MNKSLNLFTSYTSLFHPLGILSNSNSNRDVICLEEMLGVISAEFQGDKMAEAQAAIDKLDVNGDGKVSYPEFILVMKFKK